MSAVYLSCPTLGHQLDAGAMQVQEKEIQQIFCAVAELQNTEDARIPLTYITCQKRHMTRLFPGERSASERNGNVLPGAQIPFFPLYGAHCHETSIYTTCLPPLLPPIANSLGTMTCLAVHRLAWATPLVWRSPSWCGDSACILCTDLLGDLDSQQVCEAGLMAQGLWWMLTSRTSGSSTSS